MVGVSAAVVDDGVGGVSAAVWEGIHVVKSKLSRNNGSHRYRKR